MLETQVIKLKGIEAAALFVMAESSGLSPEEMVQRLLRDAALAMVTGRARKERNLISRLPGVDTAEGQPAQAEGAAQ